MKKFLSIISLTALMVGLLGSCSKINERIDALDKRVGDIENEKIASIENQIAAINSSIADLGTIRKDITDLQVAVGAKGEDISELKAADEALGQRIDELKAYVGDLSKYAEKDWVTATFATLEKQAEIVADVAVLKTVLAGLDEKIDQAIETLKSWVNEQLSAYYSKAEMDKKLKSLQDEIDGLKTSGEANKTKIAELETELAKLAQDLEAAKATITTEYKAAITQAISDYNGTITQTIQTKINEVNATITALTGRVEALETTVGVLTGRIDAIEEMIQSVSITPAYSDGSVEAVNGILTLKCIVTPAGVLTGMQSLKDSLLIYADSVKATKAATPAYMEIKVKEASILDAAQGAITLTADISNYLPKGADKALIVALKIKNGISDFTTEFVPVTVVLPVNKVTKIADYLYEYTAEGYSTEAPSELLFDDGPVPIFGCSAVRNGNFYGRNLDFNINEICEFVVRTKATATRPHASIGVANTCFLNITNDMVAAGLSEEQLKYIPWMMMDGINDAGLVCNINVVNAADLKGKEHDHTNEDAPQIMVMQLVRALLDNCGSVAEAKTYIESHDIRPIPTTWDGHIMVADPKETMIVEFTGEKGNEVKFVVQTQMIMTNFYNHLFKEEDFLRTRSINNFPAHACGMERYFILSDNYATGNSMQGMWELLKSVRYTQTYDTSVEPFWCSEYYDTPKIPTFDDYPMSYWTKEKVLEQEEPLKEVQAYKEYVKTGEYNEEDGLWFTSHNSTYDIAKKALWVTVREKYENVYKFEF